MSDIPDFTPVRLVPEWRADATCVDQLLLRAFGPGREDKVAYRFRRGVPPLQELCWTARRGVTVVGTIRYWPVTIAGATALLLGPLAVDPTAQGLGIAGTLIDHTLALAGRLGHRLVVLVGDPDYYRRFGFTSAAGQGVVIADEDPDRVLVLGLSTGMAPPSGAVQRWRGVRWHGFGDGRQFRVIVCQAPSRRQAKIRAPSNSARMSSGGSRESWRIPVTT